MSEQGIHKRVATWRSKAAKVTDAFSPKKSLGQNFLNSDRVPRWLCEAANLSVGETVLEIGPGTGALTQELLAYGAHVVAVEADARAISVLQTTFSRALASGQLTLHHTDARHLDPAALGLSAGQYAVVANIPYYLSGLLFRRLLESDHQPHTLVFLVQKEIAERIARSKKESLLSLSVKAFGTPRYVRTVSRGHFTPPPKVDSAIIAITDIAPTNFQDCSRTKFFDLLHLGFGQKRKQLLGNLAAVHGREQIASAFAEVSIPPTARAEDISLTKWLALTHTITNH